MSAHDVMDDDGGYPYDLEVDVPPDDYVDEDDDLKDEEGTELDL